MAEKKVYVGSHGPILYDDSNSLDDPDGDFSGMGQHALVTDGVAVIGGMGLLDTDASNILTLVWNEDDSADRTFNLLVGGGNRSLTLNENFTIGDGNAGTITFTGASKVLSVEDNAVVSQDYSSDASPQLANLNLTTGELTCGSINRASGTLTLEVGGVAQVSIATTGVTITPALILSTCADAAADVDKFLVLDASNNVDYRTGAEVLSDIGGAAPTSAFKTITGITNDVVADAAEDTLTLASADAKLTIVGTAGTDTITFTVVQSELDHGSIGGLDDGDHDAVYYTETEIDTWRNSVTQTEMGYVHGVTSSIQTQLDARCLESIFGTSISTGLLLDGTALKTSAVLQKYHAIDPSASVQAVLGAADDAAILALLSGDAGAAFDWNSQNLTSVGTIGCGTITTTGNYVLGDNTYVGILGAERLQFYVAGYARFLGCNLGIGAAPGDDKLRIAYAPSDDTGADGLYIDYDPTLTSGGTFYNHGLQIIATFEGVMGEKNAGYIRGMYETVMGGVGDLAALYGFGSSFGHTAGDTGTTDVVYGLFLYPYYRAGTITTLYSLYIRGAQTGGTVTNEWGIYQADDAANYLAGDLDIAGHDGSAAGLKLGGVLVTSTAAELNLLDGSTAGTIVNSKAVIYGSSGEVNGTTLQIAGNLLNVTTDGTDTTITGALYASDHGAAATDMVVNVCYGTGAPPAANTTTIGSLYIQYTA